MASASSSAKLRIRWLAPPGSAASRTGTGGSAYEARRASGPPSASGQTSLKAPSSASSFTTPVAISSRWIAPAPRWSVVKYRLAPSRDQVGCCGHTSRSGARSRPSPVARSTSHRVSRRRCDRARPSRSGCGNPAPIRRAGRVPRTTRRPGSASMRPCRSVDRRPTRSRSDRSHRCTSSRATIVAPSDVTSKPISVRLVPASGVRSVGSAIRSSPAGIRAANRWRSRGPW